MQRKDSPLRLTESPLVMVLAQVRFAPVLKMADYVPTLQESLRHRGFPGFGSQTLREIALGPQLTVKEATRWLFANAEKTEVVVLTENFVVLETSRYTVFKDFAKRLQIVLEILEEEARLSLVHRLGLRFVDLILPNDGEELQEYLKPQLHGLKADDLGVDRLLNHFESRGTTDEGQLVIRLHQNDQGAILPPDLDSTTLVFDAKPGRDSLITLLDIDHSSETDRAFDVPDILDAMWRIHKYTDRAFLSSVTPEALKRWGKE